MAHLIDTDILIDFFRKRPAAGEYLDSKGDWFYSVATAMELFAGANDKKQIAEMTRFLNAYSMLQLSLMGLQLIWSYILFGLAITIASKLLPFT